MAEDAEAEWRAEFETSGEAEIRDGVNLRRLYSGRKLG